MKRKLKFENYKSFSEENHIGDKIRKIIKNSFIN